jgi:hypothetical protein
MISTCSVLAYEQRIYRIVLRLAGKVYCGDDVMQCVIVVRCSCNVTNVTGPLETMTIHECVTGLLQHLLLFLYMRRWCR